MTRRITDLAQALSKKPASTGIGLAKATIKAWDSTTFENRLDYYGTVLEDVPVMSGTDALTYRAGDEVTLLTYHPVDGHRHRGLGSYWILGRVVRPGAENAARVIQFLQTELAKTIVDEIVEELLKSPAGQELAAFVFAQRVHTVALTTVPDSESTTSTSYTDLATPGPTLSDIDISDSGTALVFLSARVRAAQVNNGATEAFMSTAVSGATTLSPDDTRARTSYIRLSNHNGAVGHVTDLGADATGMIPLTGLNPGLHSFTAKYRSDSGGNTSFRYRSMTVIAL